VSAYAGVLRKTARKCAAHWAREAGPDVLNAGPI
jgi:hypothetical protein